MPTPFPAKVLSPLSLKQAHKNRHEQNHYMVLTLPLHVVLTLPIFQDSSPLPFGTFLKENYLTNNARKLQSRWLTVLIVNV